MAVSESLFIGVVLTVTLGQVRSKQLPFDAFDLLSEPCYPAYNHNVNLSVSNVTQFKVKLSAYCQIGGMLRC